MNLSENSWDNFLRDYPNAHLLQTSPWGEVKKAFGWEVSRLTLGDSGVQILFKPLPLGFCWAYIAKGPVGNPGETSWNTIREMCLQRRAVFLKIEPDEVEGEKSSIIHFPPAFQVRKSIHTIQPRRTLIVSLEGSEDDILTRMKQKTRYNIRLAERKGVIVYSSNDINRFYRMLEITGHRDEFGIHSQEYYNKVYEAIIAKGLGVLFLAEYKGELLSAAMIFANGKRSWYLYGASSNKHRNLMAPYAIQWQSMKWAREKGCTHYDLWGVPDINFGKLEAEFPDRSDGLWGVYRFKRGFGGDLIRSVGAWDVIFNPFMYFFYRQYVKNKKSDV